MATKTVLIISAIAGLTLVTAASARTTTDTAAPHRIAHKHHTARLHNPAVQTDVPQEQAAPQEQGAKPADVPESFYHASGSDGSHYGE